MSERILFDASRLLSRAERTVPTGVDRVCLAYAEWLLTHDDIEMIPVRSKHDQLVAVDAVWFARCVETLRTRWNGSGGDRPPCDAERRLFEVLGQDLRAENSVISPPPPAPDLLSVRPVRVWKQFFRSRAMPELPQAERYFNVGHTSLNTPDILQNLTAHGIERIVLLHDLIPITHPEFCRPGDGEKHRTRVLTALTHASRILVNSHYTAHELRLFAVREGLECPPIEAIHLGLEATFVPRPRQATPRPYFIHIGTIEARKNLAFLLTLWRRLEEQMGASTPQLVLIGRYGWENEAVLDHLQRSPNLRGLVHQAGDLHDASLSVLLKDAQALLAPSSVEGFDLPTVEACALGVPVIASDIPAHRELVPDAQLIDPLDGLGWLKALEAATRRRPTVPAYSPPTWPSHFQRVETFLGMGNDRVNMRHRPRLAKRG